MSCVDGVGFNFGYKRFSQDLALATRVLTQVMTIPTIWKAQSSYVP